MSDKTYDRLYHALFTFCCCMLAASFCYAQIKLSISYTLAFGISLCICITFILLNIPQQKLFYILVPIACAGIILGFSGIKAFPDFMSRFVSWITVSGYLEDEYSRKFSIILLVLLCSATGFVVNLLVRLYKIQLVLALVLLIAYISMLVTDTYLFKRSIIFAFLYFLIVLTEFMHMRRTGKSFDSAKHKVINTFPSIMLIFLILLIIPIKKEPFNVDVVGSIENFLRDVHIIPENVPVTFDLPFTGYTNSGLLHDSIIQKNKTVMTINVEDSTLTNIYLIGNVFDTFDGREWSTTSSNPSDYIDDYFETTYALARFNPINYSDIIQSSSLDITFNNFMSSSVFYPLKTKHLNTGGKTTISSNANLKFAQTQGDQTNYQLTYYQLNLDNPYAYYFIKSEMGYQYTSGAHFSASILSDMNDHFKNGYEDFSNLETILYNHAQYVHETYTQTPALSRPVIDYIDAITSGYNNDIDKLKAIEYTLNQYNYTLRPSVTPSDEDFLEKFLLESKEGYCTYFATAFTLMARHLGYPARYVQGFCAPAIADKNIDVSSKNAHAWSEVYFDGIGWIPFEPTPSYSDSRYTPWSTKKETPQEDAFEEITETLPQANSGDHYNIDTEEIKPILSQSPKAIEKYRNLLTALSILAVIALMPFIAYLILQYIIQSARRKYEAMSNHQKVMHDMKKILLLLSTFDITLKDNETLSEFLSRLSPEQKELAPFLDTAVAQFEEIRYGNTEVTTETAKCYDTWKNELLKTIKPQINNLKYMILWYRVNL